MIEARPASHAEVGFFFYARSDDYESGRKMRCFPASCFLVLNLRDELPGNALRQVNQFEIYPLSPMLDRVIWAKAPRAVMSSPAPRTI